MKVLAAGSALEFGGRSTMRQPASTILVVLLTAASFCQAGVRAAEFADEPFPVRVVNLSKFDRSLWPTKVMLNSGERPGTLIIDTSSHHLFLVGNNGYATRYGIAVGAAGRKWSGTAIVGRKERWPAWHPTDEMRRIVPGMPSRVAPGPSNPLGARALYLFQNGRDTLFRIHGTSEPWTIGTEVSSGCIRMFNEDVIALFDSVKVGTKVVVH